MIIALKCFMNMTKDGQWQWMVVCVNERGTDVQENGWFINEVVNGKVENGWKGLIVESATWSGKTATCSMIQFYLILNRVYRWNGYDQVKLDHWFISYHWYSPDSYNWSLILLDGATDEMEMAINWPWPRVINHQFTNYRQSVPTTPGLFPYQPSWFATINDH